MSIRFWLKLIPIAGVGLILVNLLLLAAALPLSQALPRGSKLAFMAFMAQSWDIFVMDVSRDLTARFTWNDEAKERYPAWSPDGNQLAYHSDQTGQAEIYITSRDGRETRQLTGSTESVDVNSSGVNRVILGNAMADWSPDGKRIGFHSDLGGDWDLFTISVDGGDLQQLTSEESDEVLLDWAPDGKRIIYTAGFDGFMTFVIQDLESGEVTPLINKEDLFLPDGSLSTPTQTLVDWSPSWSPDGTQIVFTSNRTGAADIYIMDVETAEVKQLTDDSYQDDNPIWASADKIIFVSDREGMGGTMIFEMDADGNNLRPITRMGYEIDAPAWYP